MCNIEIETAEEPSVAIARIRSRILGIRAGNPEHAFNLRRFVEAQANGVYERALSELRSGKKRSHWMWFVFPQHRSLGRSATAKFYGLSGDEEAAAYLAHPLLGPRLRECVEAVRSQLNIGTSLEAIFGKLDAMNIELPWPPSGILKAIDGASRPAPAAAQVPVSTFKSYPANVCFPP